MGYITNQLLYMVSAQINVRIQINNGVNYEIRIVKCVTKLFIHLQTSTVQPLKFWNGWCISSHTLLYVWLLIHAEIKVKPC